MLTRRKNREIRRATFNLFILPPEVMVEIFRHMHWKAILCARQTCTKLFEVSKARSVWTTLFERCTNTLLYPPRLVEPIEKYSTKELENLLLMGLSGQVGWNSHEPPTERLTKGDILGTTGKVLLEGGRWLLTCGNNIDGVDHVHFYDLDSDPQSLLLYKLFKLNLSAGGVDFLPEKIIAQAIPEEESSFYVVLHSRFWGAFGSTLMQYQFYHVKQQGRGSQATLVANSLNSFIYNQNSFNLATKLCLLGDYIMESPEHDFLLVEVYNWRTATPAHHDKSWFLSDQPLSFSRLLPGNKILCVHAQDLLTIYGLPAFKKFTLQDSNNGFGMDGSRAQPIWKLPLDAMVKRSERRNPGTPNLNISEPCIGKTSTRVSLRVEGSIYGLVIPHDESEPQVIFLAKSLELIKPESKYVTLAIDKAYIESHDIHPDAITVTFSWPTGKETTKWEPQLVVGRKRKWLSRWNGYRGPALIDEPSGRLIRATTFEQSEEDDLDVYDTDTGPWSIIDFCAPQYIPDGSLK